MQDRRGARAGMVGGGIGVVVLALIAMFLGVDPGVILGGGDAGPTPGASPGGAPPPDDEGANFVAVVLGSTEDVWRDLFASAGQQYQEPTLVLFSDATSSACGFAQSAVGPFYCPRDASVYIDLAFYAALRDRLGAPGDFAQAYVIAHEVGHHVQHLLGVAQQVTAAQQRASSPEANELSVRLELQADCLAGMWAHHADQQRQILEQGDIEEAMNAAAAIGDDRLQRRSQGYVVPESFTHGSSEQRVRWFRRGFDQGSLDACDTFSAGAA